METAKNLPCPIGDRIAPRQRRLQPFPFAWAGNAFAILFLNHQCPSPLQRQLGLNLVRETLIVVLHGSNYVVRVP